MSSTGPPHSFACAQSEAVAAAAVALMNCLRSIINFLSNSVLPSHARGFAIDWPVPVRISISTVHLNHFSPSPSEQIASIVCMMPIISSRPELVGVWRHGSLGIHDSPKSLRLRLSDIASRPSAPSGKANGPRMNTDKQSSVLSVFIRGPMHFSPAP